MLFLNYSKSVPITNRCKRINLLIGKPNVGKSNILEAIGLFGLGYSRFNKNKKLSQFIRFDNTPELFFDGNTSEPITVAINDDGNEPSCRVDYQNSNNRNLTETIRLFDKQLTISLFINVVILFFRGSLNQCI